MIAYLHSIALESPNLFKFTKKKPVFNGICAVTQNHVLGRGKD